jgi:hypothetical protein
MRPTIGWFPRYSTSGQLTVQGNGQWRNQWLRDGIEIHGDGAHLVIDGQVTSFLDGNELSAAGGRWACLRTDPIRIFTSDGRTEPDAGCPAITADHFAYVDQRQAAQKWLLLDSADRRIHFGAITDVRMSRQALVWSESGESWGMDLRNGEVVKLQVSMQQQEFAPIPIDTPDGPWVLNHTQTGIILRPFGDAFGYRFDNGGQCYSPDGIWLAGGLAGAIAVAFSNDRGVITELPFPLGVKRIDLRVPVVVAPPPAPLPIGPTTPPRAADGRVYDMAPFIHCDPALSARGGPGQQENVQIEMPDGILLYGKFGTPGAYEMYGTDANWMVSLEDASGPTESQSWTDPRWFPMQQAIGEAHAFVTGPHEAIRKDRHTCRELRREPFNRKMWLHQLWDQFDWGPELGVRATVMRVYDPASAANRVDGGKDAAKRVVEVRYEAVGAGWVRWEAHRSDRVYPRGINGGAEFTDASLIQRVDFYRLGGSNVQPKLTGCVPAVVPHLPPLSSPAPTPPAPKPTPPTIPVPKKETRMFVDVTKPLIDAVQGDEVQNDDGSVSVKCAAGYLSVDAFGTVSFKPEINGDEKFTKVGDCLVSINTFSGTKIKLLPFRETA